MEGGLSLQTRRELLQQVIPHYREASTVKKKSKLLDTFTAMTGYNRKYAMWLFNHMKEGQQSLVPLFQKRGVQVDLGNWEVETEAAQFNGIAEFEGVERPKTLFLAVEDFDEGKLRTDQQVFLDAGAGAVL